MIRDMSVHGEELLLEVENVRGLCVVEWVRDDVCLRWGRYSIIV